MGLKDLITDNTNTDLDIVSVLGVALVVTFIGLSIYAAIHPEYKFDPQAWAIGAGALLGAVGGAYWAKSGRDKQGDNNASKEG